MKSGRLKRILTVVILLAVVGYLCFLCLPLFDNSDFEVTLYQVVSPKITSRVRIAFLADLHLSVYGKDNSALVSTVESMRPDIIAVGGDMMNYDDPDYSVAIRLCEQLVEIAPVYYCYGNNEFTAILFLDSKIGEALKAVGVHVLHDDAELCTVGENVIQICGITESPSELMKTYGRTTTALDNINAEFGEYDGFRLLLTHYPESFQKELADFSCDLALSGHAHGGQIIVPKLGGLYTPDQGFLPKLTEGYHVFSNNSLIISRGLGNNSRIPRINNKPELVVIDLMWR